MNRKPAVHVPEVSGIDLEYRPRDYFWALDADVRLPSGIAGEARRRLYRARIEAGVTIHDGLDVELLHKEMRQGRIHPRNMGGEYLPPLRKAEVEIARISLDSTTADQISVRARRLVGRIGYRVVDEYPESSTYACHPASSVAPLSLRELITLMESASEGGSIVLPILGIAGPTEGLRGANCGATWGRKSMDEVGRRRTQRARLQRENRRYRGQCRTARDDVTDYRT